MPEAPSVWLNRKETADYMTSLGCPCSAATLMGWARNNNAGKGPPYTVAGWRTVRYKRSDIEAWVKQRVRRVA